MTVYLIDVSRRRTLRSVRTGATGDYHFESLPARLVDATLRVQAGDEIYQVVQAWDDGFSLEASAAHHLRGRVDLYDGTKLLSQCLIVASEEDGDLLRFEYKRMTEATGEQPLDFERAANAPIALIAKA